MEKRQFDLSLIHPNIRQKVSSLLSSFSLQLKDEYVVVPGFCDVHVHLREPGFSYKETILTGSLAAAHGGYTAVCSMPNLNPVPDSLKNLSLQLELINSQAVISIYPYASITIGQKGEEISNFDELWPHVIAFSDDGRGVQSEEMMRRCMIKAKGLNKMIVAHCEINDLLKGGYINEGEYSKKYNHKGICKESEYLQIERDVHLAKETGCAYHVCHISCKESVEIIKKAKKDGINVTCETAPHYLLMTEDDLIEDGRFKMNPPLRTKDDRKALIDGIIDGTIDMIATDHAPHALDEKNKGLANSAFGIVGLETAFPLMYTYFVKSNIISMDNLLNLMVYNPRKRFNIPLGLDFSVWNLNKNYIINSNDFVSLGKSTPFEGKEVFGKNYLTAKSGIVAYKDKSIK